MLTSVLLRLLAIGKNKPLGAAAFIILLLIVASAFLADLIAVHGPNEQNIPSRLRPPSIEFFFGTDSFGRDTFSRVVHGARISLYVGVLSMGLSAVIGLVIGTVSGYVGGRLDLAIQRFVDILLAFPSLILALLMVTALGPSTQNVLIAVVVAITPQIVRLARSQTLSIKEANYIVATQAIGATSWRIIWRHIVPNALSSVVVQATGYVEQGIITEATLSFLGLGVPPPNPSWGRMLQEGATGFLEIAPWLTVFPGLALALTVFGFALLGDAARDILDPRQSSQRAKPDGLPDMYYKAKVQRKAD